MGLWFIRGIFICVVILTCYTLQPLVMLLMAYVGPDRGRQQRATC
jgi:hypothetical protein